MVLRGEIRGPVQEVNTGCWSTRVVSVEIPISGSLGGPHTRLLLQRNQGEMDGHIHYSRDEGKHRSKRRNSCKVEPIATI